jgi:hypothetical protein
MELFSLILTVYDLSFVIDHGLTFQECKGLLEQWSPTMQSDDATVVCGKEVTS